MIRNLRNNTRSRIVSCVMAAALAMSGLLGAGSAKAEETPSEASSSPASPVPSAIPSLGIVQITGGLSHTVALKSDGSVWTWGDGFHGKLGTGPNVNRYTPSRVKELFDVTAIAAGMNHTLALRKDGTVWSWGQNTKGQLGDGTREDRTAPFEIPYLSNVVAIAAGNNHSMALKSDGTIVTWGDNSKGQLGDGTFEDKLEPRQLSYPRDVKAIAAGGNHSLALLDDQFVAAWGDNAYGQLGDAVTQEKANTPTRVNFTNETKAIAAGGNFSAALKDNGEVWTWGYNSSGQLGNGGGFKDRNFAARATGVNDAVSIAAGNSHIIVLHKDGTVSGWGLNNYGQLGTGDLKEAIVNTNIDSLKQIAVIGTGLFHSMAVKPDGTVYAWGNSTLGQLGDGEAKNRIIPSVVPRFSLLVAPPDMSVDGKYSYTNTLVPEALAAGDSYTMVWKAGSLWTWGENVYGQLGRDGIMGKNKPGAVNGITDAASVASGSGHAAVLHPDGTLSGWGLNLGGQLGEEPSIGRKTPQALLGGWKDMTAVAAGNAFTIALRKDGTVWALGDNAFGQQGDGTMDRHTSPVQIPGLMRIKAIAAGYNHALALADDGTVWSWGDNSNGQLGDGSTMLKRSAQQIVGLEGIIAIAAGKNHSIALKSDGTVWTWGYNGYGQLGDESTTNHSYPGRVAGISNVTAIAGGAFHTLAVRSDGTVWGWGYNAFGQLGDNTTENRKRPVQAQGIRGAAQIAAGSSHSAAMSADGTVWTWGGNMSGQLGDGTFKNRTVPAAVTGFVRSMSDTAGHWAEETIASALEKGYADGYPDGRFQPDGTVTRAEFAKLAASAVKLTIPAAEAGQEWYAPYAAALANAGYYGPEDTGAAWNEPITRGEIAAIAVRAADKELQKPNTVMTKEYAMQTAVQKGILQGLDNGRLAPEETTTRAQAVTIIERMLTLLGGGKLPVDEAALRLAAS
ncbi:S-layer homology domain-containing protein [Paenibacillus sp. H1-7]|uniref:RCC1 domain-containing protein n=1 Tax=Paenibacillus sp. H1-7 TaxID=2282849 RepID=UPI001EF7FB68|nr:S-layer homology domain-containing protein [Paenibacillus sp. H1-7]